MIALQLALCCNVLQRELRMTREEYEAHRRRLGEELRAAIGLAEEGYRARLRALDLAWEESAPGVPAPPEASRRRRRRRELYQEVLELLPRLPDVFSKEDLAPLFDDPPDRASLFRVLQELTFDGVLRQEQRGQGRYASRYRKGTLPQGS